MIVSDARLEKHVPAVDATLVEGLRLPKIPGLPGIGDAGIDPKQLLGPPSPSSLAGKADLAAVRGAQLLRTPAGDAWAQRMNEGGMKQLWSDFAARHRDQVGPVQGWLGTALLAATLASTAATTLAVKDQYDRPRPFVLDARIKPPFRLPRSSSYPSGHASAAFAAARVISRLAPSLGGEAYNLARQVAVSRVYSGVHFPSDVVAGALLGTGVADVALRTAGWIVPGTKRVALTPGV